MGDLPSRHLIQPTSDNRMSLVAENGNLDIRNKLEIAHSAKAG